MADTNNIEWSHAMNSSQLSAQQLVQRTATWQGHNQKKARTTLMKQFQNKTLMKQFPNKTFLKQSGYRVIVLLLLHEATPKQNPHEAIPKQNPS
jgi:hypothetical protein